jgi:predicted secreted protein
MGCIACATTVSSVAKSVCGAEAEVKVDLDGAIVRVAGKIRAGGRDPARVGASLAAKLEEAGFPATRIGGD